MFHHRHRRWKRPNSLPAYNYKSQTRAQDTTEKFAFLYGSLVPVQCIRMLAQSQMIVHECTNSPVVISLKVMDDIHTHTYLYIQPFASFLRAQTHTITFYHAPVLIDRQQDDNENRQQVADGGHVTLSCTCSALPRRSPQFFPRRAAVCVCRTCHALWPAKNSCALHRPTIAVVPCAFCRPY